MTFFSRLTVGACALAVAALGSVPARSAPLATAGAAEQAFTASSAGSLIHKASGCHQTKANHMVYLWGYNAWHRHTVPGCQPIPESAPGYIPPPYTPPVYGPPPYTPPGYVKPGWGGSQYCHRNWKNHFHPGWGGGWHKHVGPNCKPRRGKKWKGGSKKNCVNVFGVWICG